MELAGGHSAAGLDFTALLQPGLCETDHHPAKQTQRKSGLGVADPAVIFAQSYIQSVMQAALDDPIATFELEKVCRSQLFESETADEINDFGGLFTFAPDPPPQPRAGLGTGKVHLLRGYFLAIQHSDLMSPPVVLPAQGVGARGGLRGKNAAQ